MLGLSLFSGIGGIDLGLEMAGITIAGQVEIDPFCRRVLEKNFPSATRWTDIRNISVDDIRSECGDVGIIAGGFPCQDISTAGKGAGLDGSRSGLWWEMHRLVSGIRPTWVLIENVPALRSRGADRVLASLEELGYTCWALVVGCWTVGGHHQRERVWIIGTNSHSLGRKIKRSGWLLNCEWSTLWNHVDRCHHSEVGTNADRQGRAWQGRFAQSPFCLAEEWEPPRTVEPGLDRKLHGISGRLDLHRVRALGNAVIPQIVYLIGLWIMGQDN